MRKLFFAAVVLLCAVPLQAREAGFGSSCSADCLLTSCSIQCSAGKGGGAACTCAWGFASCACGGGGSASIAISKTVMATDLGTGSQTMVWREAAPAPGAAPQPQGRAVVPATPSQSTVYVPSDAKKAQLVKLESLFRAFATPASQQALKSAKDVHKALLAGDVAGYKRAGEEYAKALQALTPDQRSAVAAFIEAFETCKAREATRSSELVR